MVELVMNRIMIIHVIARMALLERTALSMLIGVHRAHAKMVLLVHNAKIHTNVIVYRAGLESCVTLRWFPVKMLPFERALMPEVYAITELAKISEILTDVIVIKDIPDRIAKRKSTNVNRLRARMAEHAKI